MININLKKIIFISLVLLLFSSVSSHASWDNPTLVPPLGNAYKPVHVGQDHQRMSGTLVIGANNFTGTSTQHGLIVEKGFFYIGPPSATRFAVERASVGGNVGINTNDPAYKLDVRGVGAFGISGAENIIHFVDTPAADTDVANKFYVDTQIAAATSSAEIWLKNGNEIYYNTDNVGIGTNDPGALLDVNGNVIIRANLDMDDGEIDNVNYYDVNSGDGYGIRFWSNNSYKISMGNVGEYHYGPVTDYSIKNSMSNTAGRGWTWGINGAVPIAAMDITGTMQFAGDVRAMGDISIGTNNPLYKLDVRGAGAFGTARSENMIHFVDAPASDTDAANKLYVDSQIAAATSSSEIWLKNGSEIYYNTDNVGIGTNNPSYKFHTVGDGYFTTTLGVGITPSTVYAINSAMSQTNASGQRAFRGTLTPQATANGTYYNIGGSFYNEDNVNAGVTNSGYAMGADIAGYLNGPGTLNSSVGARIDTGTNSGGTGVVNTARGVEIRILNQGSGTITNAYGAHISVNAYSGTISNAYGVYMSDIGATNGWGIYQAGSNDDNYFAGDVGIGTNNPLYKLDVRGAGAFGTSGSENIIHFVDAPAADTDVANKFYVDSQIAAATSSSEIWLKNGNEIYYNADYVGIGTNNPSYDLDVSGIGRFTGTVVVATPTSGGHATTKTYVDAIDYWDSSGVEVWLDATYSRIGIGTTNPDDSYALHVVGDVLVGGELTVEGSDLAEEFITLVEYEAGTVLVMGDDGFKSAKPCSIEYDKTVLGVVSDMASVVMGQVDSPYKAIVGMIGVVETKVNNSNGQIEKGDLLTTSAVFGQAMRDTKNKPGTIIGKALEHAQGYEDTIMVFVNLQ